MTMPEKIWAYTYDMQLDDDSWDTDIPAWSVDNPEPVIAHVYIRADIAEELARALDMAQVWLNYDGRYDMQGINAALASYRAIALDTRASSV